MRKESDDRLREEEVEKERELERIVLQDYITWRQGGEGSLWTPLWRSINIASLDTEVVHSVGEEPIDGDRGPKSHDTGFIYIRSVPLNTAQFVLDGVEVYVPSWKLPGDINGGASDICGRGSSWERLRGIFRREESDDRLIHTYFTLSLVFRPPSSFCCLQHKKKKKKNKTGEGMLSFLMWVMSEFVFCSVCSAI